eukprot:Clim_evm30s156 gene=Clim_evmTU30s156
MSNAGTVMGGPALVAGGIAHHDSGSCELGLPTEAEERPRDQVDDSNQEVVDGDVVAELAKGVMMKEDVIPIETPRGLKVDLLSHQKSGVGWMLTDEQGLGKTIQMLSLCLLNPPSRAEKDGVAKRVISTFRDQASNKIGKNRIEAQKAVRDLTRQDERWHNLRARQPRHTRLSGVESNTPTPVKDISNLPSLSVKKKLTRAPYRNLIVMPATLIDQWAEEIHSRLSGAHKVYLYRSGVHTMAPPEFLASQDFVLVSYETLRLNMPAIRGETKESQTNKRKLYEFDVEKAGNIFRVFWHRIILDEASRIKDALGQSSTAVYCLQGKHRWCLTGTPVENGVHDLYSLFRFLRYRPFNSPVVFGRVFMDMKCTPQMAVSRLTEMKIENQKFQGETVKKLRHALAAIMMRRTKEFLRDGNCDASIMFTDAQYEWIDNELTPEERDYYKHLELGAQYEFAQHVYNGTLGTESRNLIFVRISQLRAAVNHARVVHYRQNEVSLEEWGRKDSIARYKRKRASLSAQKEKVASFKRDGSSRPQLHMDDEGNPQAGKDNVTSASLDVVHEDEESMAVLEKQRSVREKAKAFFSATGYAALQPRMNRSGQISAECPVCVEIMTDLIRATALECGHFLHDSCLQSWGYPGCPSCNSSITKTAGLLEVMLEEDFMPLHSHLSVSSTPQRTPRRIPRRSMQGIEGESRKLETSGWMDVRSSLSHHQRPDDPSSVSVEELGKEHAAEQAEYHRQMAEESRQTLMHNFYSAKLRTVASILHRIFEVGDEDDPKVLVFSLSSGMLTLLSQMLDEKDIGWVRYDGTLTFQKKQEVIREFKTNDRKQVVLCQIKAAAYGLNLTVANHVILTDGWWNPAVEDQAINRVHRIGQTKPVRVYKIVTKDSVETRVEEIAALKRKAADGVVDDKEDGDRLSAQHLFGVFGLKMNTAQSYRDGRRNFAAFTSVMQQINDNARQMNAAGPRTQDSQQLQQQATAPLEQHPQVVMAQENGQSPHDGEVSTARVSSPQAATEQ